MILAFTLAGIVLIGVLGFVGRRRPAADLAEWTVGGRRFGALTMWFLQAGEVFTTFTFLGMAGLAFSGGVAAMYYLQLQITGLGLIVRLVTGDTASGTLSMVTGSVLVVAFVLWAGLRGVAATSYFKDGIMLVALVVLLIAVPTHFAGGIPAVFHKIEQLHPEKLIVHSGTNDHVWFVTSMVVSATGVALMTLPHSWPALMSARDPKVLRRNYTWMPVYELCLLLPMIIGFAAILVVPKGSDPNGVLLTLSKDALPGWVTGLIVVAATATAMVPAAGILIGISSLVARNIVRVRGERKQFWINHGTVVLASTLALVLGIFRPDLLANLLLLTYSGSVQLAPANLLGFLRRVPVGKGPVLAGLVAGEFVVLWLTFVDKTLVGHVNVGLVGLGANVVVLGLAVLVERAVATREVPAEEAA